LSAICGIVHFDGAPVDRADLITLVEGSPYRGPDGTRFHLDGNAGFAHLAFYVSPESTREQQPLLSPDGQLVLLADVRLDNRAELAGKLDVEAAQLPELTDPELLLLAYRKWAELCLDHLLGDFVFAVWDCKRQELFLARDALGARGLVWAKFANKFVFASEITSILELPFVDPRINEDAVLKTLGSLGLAEDETHFQEIFHLPPASCMKVSRDGLKNRKYWQIDPGFKLSYRSEAEYTDQFLELLQQSVACRLQHNVGPVGISLSGGYDSTLLAALAAGELRKRSPAERLKSFSYVFDQFTECDERQYFEPVISRFNIEAHYVLADSLWTFSQLDPQAVHQDFLWTNGYSQLPEAIAGSAQMAGCRLLIDGMFGDALFCEPGLFAADLIRNGQLLNLIALLWRYCEEMDWWQELVQYGLRPLIPKQLRRAWRSIHPATQSVYAPGLHKSRLKRLHELAQVPPAPGPQDELSPAHRNRYYRIFQTQWAQGYSAVRARPYNQAGLEPVSPYFDAKLVEFILAIPAEVVTHPGRPRRLQNEAMQRLLPAQTCQRVGKTSFEPLLQAGLLEKERNTVNALTRNSLMIEKQWVDADWLNHQLADNNAVLNDNFYLSTILHLELWLRNTESLQKN